MKQEKMDPFEIKHDVKVCFRFPLVSGLQQRECASSKNHNQSQRIASLRSSPTPQSSATFYRLPFPFPATPGDTTSRPSHALFLVFFLSLFKMDSKDDKRPSVEQERELEGGEAPPVAAKAAAKELHPAFYIAWVFLMASSDKKRC